MFERGLLNIGGADKIKRMVRIIRGIKEDIVLKSSDSI